MFQATSSAASPPSPTSAQGRGVWFWRVSGAQDCSAATIVGNASLEKQTIANFNKWGMTTIYGSYAFQGEGGQAAVRAWNRKLAARGIASYLLIANTEYLFPDHWLKAREDLMANFVEFNRASQPAERFAGVAFDIEPHIFTGSPQHSSWKHADGQERRRDVDEFLVFLQKTRNLLNQSGERNARIEISLATWYSKLNGKIGWNDGSDRDQWFKRLAQICDRVSIMDFEAGSTNVILDRYREESGLLDGKSRIALRANLGMEWKSVPEFWTALQTIERQAGQRIDIQDYALLCASWGDR